jgi:hypothetical protein
VNKLCSSILFCFSILVFHPIYFLIHYYVSSIIIIHPCTHGKIIFHVMIYYMPCVKEYSFDISLMSTKYSKKDLVLLTCWCSRSHSCSHTHHLASLLQSMSNKNFVGDQWLCIVTQVFECRMLGTIHATKLQMEFLYWAWTKHNCNWNSCKHNAT